MVDSSARARVVAYTIMDLMADIFTIALRITQIYIGSAYESGELVFNDLLVADRSVTCLKLYISAYHGTHTEGYQMFGYVCLLGLCLHTYTITNHLDRNHKAWARARIFGMSILVVAGVSLLCLGMVIPKNHAWAWHNTVVHSINIVFISLEAGLLVRSQMKENGGNEHLLRDLLIALVETLITTYRFVISIAQTNSPWDADAEKILHLVGAGLPVLIGTCQICWILYKAHIRPKAVVGWLVKIPRVFARKTEQAAGATTGGSGGRDAVDQVADEHVEEGNGLPVTIGASQVSWIAYTAGIKFKVIKWFRKNRRVSAAEAAQAAGTAMDNYGGGDSEQQVQEEDVASPA